MRRLFPLILLVAMAGCSASPTPGPQTPANTGNETPTPDTSKTPPPDTTAKDEPKAEPKAKPDEAKPAGGDKAAYREEELTEPKFDLVITPLPAAPKGLAPAPKACDAFASRKPAAAPVCAERAQALEALDKALAEKNADKRDAALAGLESCGGLPPGLTRALRAELAPTACADVILEPVIAAPPKGIDGAVYTTMRGLATAARLSRAGDAPPKITAPYDKKKLVAFINGPVKDWVAEQATAIQALSNEGAGLRYYARGVAAIEAGMADLRLVEAVRAVPLSPELAKDAEARNIYYAELDQTLDPRKDRGRDAVLVGLRDLAAVGVLRDARIDRARGLLARLYGGRRIDALDGLVVPPLPKATPADVTERLATKLPTFYAGLLLPKDAATKTGVLRSLIERGVPLSYRAALKNEKLADDARRMYARARVELGRVYLRAVDFDQAASLYAGLPEGARTDEDAFFAALVAALRNGPEDAATMVRSAPVSMLGMGQIAGLDAITKAKGPFAGAAAFDAALIKQITAPIGADAAYFRDVATRFREAGSLLTDAAQRKTAEDRAKAAEATASAIH
ncbi:hypothetical protein [Polyangium sp. y55x31]|uniref:hypothetical protein n=1 Tax=Polyangium sp. y55x31 TaxID=3042688 RepID=UPI002482BAE8|nr:hypothetical protein [Polyangium sp. y55x31]MDI1483536.1 hypothetical protein [Polyangium sp. y55x31]